MFYPPDRALRPGMFIYCENLRTEEQDSVFERQKKISPYSPERKQKKRLPQREPFICNVNNSLSVNRCHVSDKIENLVRVTNLIVVPRNNLNESICQSDTCFCVED